MEIIKTPSGACLKIQVNEDIEISVSFDNRNCQKNIDATGKTGEVYNRPEMLIFKNDEQITKEIIGEDYFIPTDFQSLVKVLTKIYFELSD